jgi:hypothetical protein
LEIALADTSVSSASPRILTTELGTYAPSQSQFISDPLANVLDKDWVSNAFMMGNAGFSDPDDVANRYYSTANMKFTDTRLGASIGINPRPQFCQYSDVPVPGRLNRNTPSINDFNGNYGMGRQYSEMVDDAAQRVYMTFGVAQFNSLFQFFTAAYETNQVTLARTGRAQSFFYNSGKFIGAAALLYAFPLISVGMFVGKLYDFFISHPKSKFYSIKPTMHLYWSAVNQLVQAMAVNRGIMPKFLSDADQQRVGQPYYLDSDYLQGLSNFMPDIFRDAGLGVLTFDMYSVATKAQRIANAILVQEYNDLNNSDFDPTSFNNYVKKTMTGNGGHATPITDEEGNLTLSATFDSGAFAATNLLASFFNRISSLNTYVAQDGDTGQGIELDLRADTQTVAGSKNQTEFRPDAKIHQEGKDFLSQFDAIVRDGGLFATFIVNHTGPVSESWSSQVQESELAQKLNGVVSSMAEARFTLAEGNIIGGAAGAAVGAVASAVTDTAEGVLSGITGGLSDVVRGLAGAGFIDVPKHWTNSSFQATRSSYEIELISPYGNPISLLMDLDIPMAMLMAGGLPLSTGKSSYTSPLLCQIYDKGRCQIRLGIIDSLSFTRGTSHLSFADAGHALKIDVQFSVTDLSSIMHMPISSGFSSDADMTMDDDNILQDYLAVLAGMTVESQIYDMAKIKIRLAKAIMNASRLTSPAYWGSAIGNTPVGDIMRIFTRQTAILDYQGARV